MILHQTHNLDNLDNIPQALYLKAVINMVNRLLIGISVCLMHPDPSRKSAPSKTLQFIEQSTAHWVMSGAAIPVLIPSPFGDTARGEITCADYAQKLDGLVLHGGADIWPGHYGESAVKPEWNGDARRDAYELELLRAFVAVGKPVFGICRGLQLINVAFGGTLFQDLLTQAKDAQTHQDRELYEHLFHGLEIVPGSKMEQLLGQSASAKINSIHHQGINKLASGFTVEAICPEDGVIEAIRLSGDQYIAAVQWHPELHQPAQGVLDDTPLLHDFLQAAAAVRG